MVMSAAFEQTRKQESKSYPFRRLLLLRNLSIFLLTQKGPEGIFIAMGVSAVVNDTVFLISFFGLFIISV